MVWFLEKGPADKLYLNHGIILQIDSVYALKVGGDFH